MATKSSFNGHLHREEEIATRMQKCATQDSQTCDHEIYSLDVFVAASAILRLLILFSLIPKT